jgi:hypothetical protein
VKQYIRTYLYVGFENVLQKRQHPSSALKDELDYIRYFRTKGALKAEKKR